MKDKIRFHTSHSDGSRVFFTVPVIACAIDKSYVLVRVAQQVRNLPFPPFGGKRIVRIRPELAGLK